MAYEKLLNEIYAALSLKYLWKKYEPFFIKSESPDWINETMELGLEVSQALLPDDGQTESFIEQYLGCRKEELPVSAMERYGERLHFYNDRFWAVLPEKEGSQDYLKKAEYRFDKKLEKLNKGYLTNKYNGLYLFLHPGGEHSKVNAEPLFAYMKKKQAHEEIKFDWVFLNCITTIYVCDFKADTIEEIQLPKNAANFLDRESESLRYLVDWKDGAPLGEV